MHIKNLITISTIVFATSALFAGNALADKTYVTDQGHTEITFGWSHAGVSMQHGEFLKSVGMLNLGDDMEKSTINVVIETASLSSGFAALDQDLMSKNFLEVETYPEITFQSTSVAKTGDKTFDVSGDLTIHGVTQPVTLKAELTHIGEHPLGGFIDYYKGDWVAFKATTDIDHQAFGVGSFSTGPIFIEINTELKAKSQG